MKGFRSDIVNDLKNGIKNYPLLTMKKEGEIYVIRGEWEVGTKDQYLQSYEIEIEVTGGYPEEMPSVYEAGGRIDRTLNNHFYNNGSCCLEHPVKYAAIILLENFNFKFFMKNLVGNFFLYHTCKFFNKKYPFGEWKHGDEGHKEVLEEIMKSDEKDLYLNLLNLYDKNESDYNKILCPCGSGKYFQSCHKNFTEQLYRTRKRLITSKA